MAQTNIDGFKTMLRWKVLRIMLPKDVCKNIMRKEIRNAFPRVLDSEKRFAEHLMKCPVCGETPHFLKVSCNSQSGNSYKLMCKLHTETRELECGDWFDTPSKAGKDWNERVRAEKLDYYAWGVYCKLRSDSGKLTRQQVRTLKDQIFAGDAEGALKGLKKLIGEEACRTCERNDLKK